MSYDSHELIETLAETGWLVDAELELACQAAEQAYDRESLIKLWLEYGILNVWQTQQLFAGLKHFTVGNYLLLDFLGEGATGRVFLARHQYMDRLASLKLIRRECSDDPVLLRRLLHEAKLLIQIQHPNLAEMYDLIQVGNRYSLVLEYVDGCDLQQYIEAKGPLSTHDFLDFTRQITCGLNGLHSMGLVHGDLKPANIMVRGEQDELHNRLKIIDLGVSRFRVPAEEAESPRYGYAETGDMFRDDSLDSQILPDMDGSQPDPPLTPTFFTQIGSFDYLAPERARLPKERSLYEKKNTASESAEALELLPAADLYALGALFYFMLCGHPPFSGGSWQEKLLRRQTETASPVSQWRPEMPPLLEQLIARLLERDPLKRGTLEEVETELHTLALRYDSEMFDTEEFFGSSFETMLRESSSEDSSMASIEIAVPLNPTAEDGSLVPTQEIRDNFADTERSAVPSKSPQSVTSVTPATEAPEAATSVPQTIASGMTIGPDTSGTVPVTVRSGSSDSTSTGTHSASQSSDTTFESFAFLLPPPLPPQMVGKKQVSQILTDLLHQETATPPIDPTLVEPGRWQRIVDWWKKRHPPQS
ncbi:MAG: serine/threonine-protein kinase [Thermoguttaceae bacterium]|nr:serine/threonine-protein kinase [Thermoguttaceae bacterium]